MMEPGPSYRSDIVLQAPVSEDTFNEVLMNYYKCHYLDEGPVDDTSFLLNAVLQFSPFLPNSNLGYIFVEFLFGFFEVCKYKRCKLVFRTLYEHGLRTQETLELLRNDKDYCSVKPHCHELNTDPDWTPWIILKGYNVLKRMLRYGVPSHLKENLGDSFLRQLKVLFKFKYSIFNFRDLSGGNGRRLTFILIAVFITYQKLYSLSKRTPVHNMGYGHAYNSLCLLFKTWKDPLITLPEFERILNALMMGERFKSERQAYSGEFVKLFPKSVDPIGPRTLKHLCRVQVRESLNFSGNLPHGVWCLKLPKRIQNYILLQRTEDEFHSKYVRKLTALASKPSINFRDSKRQKKLHEK